MGLAFVPLYIKYLGMESYGLIGLFTMLQTWLTLLDMGMTPTLSREMSRFTGGAHTSETIRELLRSLEVVCLSIALLITVGVWCASGWLASDWLRVEKLPVSTVANAFSMMGIVIALRFVEGLYRGAIIGLQRQVLLNVISSLQATVRGLGAVAVLAYVSPTIGSFFIWQGLISLPTIAIFSIVVYRSLPTTDKGIRFSRASLEGVWHFAAGMMATTLLSLLLMQVDKVILSRVLSLESFGQYSLAGVITGALYTITGPVVQAFYPRMTELMTRKDDHGLISIYHLGSQVISVLVGTAAMVLILFGERLVALWTGNITLAHNVAPLVALLSAGTCMHCLMHVPYMLQLANGWTRFGVNINIVAVIVLVPGIMWVTPRYGAIGAASIWVLLNSGYLLISMHFMHRRLIPGEKWRWYLKDTCLPIGAATIVSLLLRYWQPSTMPKYLEFAWFFVVGGVTVITAALAAQELRYLLFSSYRSWQLQKKCT